MVCIVYFMSLLFWMRFVCVCVVPAAANSIVPNVQSLKTKNYFSILLINFTYTQFVNYDLRRFRSTITFHHLLSVWPEWWFNVAIAAREAGTVRIHFSLSLSVSLFFSVVHFILLSLSLHLLLSHHCYITLPLSHFYLCAFLCQLSISL